MDHLPGVDVSQPSGRNTIMPGRCSARLPYVASAELAKKKRSVSLNSQKKTQTNQPQSWGSTYNPGECRGFPEPQWSPPEAESFVLIHTRLPPWVPQLILSLSKFILSRPDSSPRRRQMLLGPWHG